MDHETGLALLRERVAANPPSRQEGDATKVSRLRPFDGRVLPPEDPEREEQIKLREKERKEREREQIIADRWQSCSVPYRLKLAMDQADMTPDDHGWRKRLNQIASRLGKGMIFGLLGGYGCGKSQLGVALIALAVREQSCAFTYAADLFDTIKDTFRSEGSSVRKQFSNFIEPGLLVVDEVNVGMSEADTRYLQRVVCQRYDAVRDTLLISNEGKATFESLVGDRVVSRMIEAGGVIECDWSSFRGAK